MDALDFVSRITGAGFKLAVRDGLILVSPVERLTGPQRAFIRQHKPALVAALAGQAPAQAVAVPAHHADPEQTAAAIRAGWTWHGGRWHRPGHWEAARAARPADPPPQAIPDPDPAAVPAVGGAGIRCADCRHREPTQHAALVRCKAGREAPATCGLWWALDRRNCPAFAALVLDQGAA